MVAGCRVRRHLQRERDGGLRPGRDRDVLLDEGDPGTDVFGLLLLIPVVRDVAGNVLLRRWTRKFTVRRIGYGTSYGNGNGYGRSYGSGEAPPPNPRRELEP